MKQDKAWTTSGQYRVKPHNPGRAIAFRIVAGLVVLLACWGAYDFGRKQGGYDRRAARERIEALTEQVSILNSRIDELMLENAQLSSDSAIDSTASKQMGQRLRQLNEEMLELKEELVFYRSLLSPAELEPGLQILGIQMARENRDNVYNYKIVLTQRHNRFRYAAGEVSVRLQGLREGEQAQLDLEDLINREENELSFRFKNFQSLEGRLTLPDGFEPKDILVSVVPKTRGIKQIERSYEWNSIVSGG